MKFGIDKTAPTIDVTYNNNSVNNGRFFKNNRIATITVTERNFNEEDFKYKVTKNGKKQNIKLKWKKVKGKGNKDNEKYICQRSDFNYAAFQVFLNTLSAQHII